MKAQASARVDVPTAPFFFCSEDHGVQHVCKFFCECLPTCLSGTDRDLERVSAVKRVNAWICTLRTPTMILQVTSPIRRKICNNCICYRTKCFLNELRRCCNEASLCFSTTTIFPVCRIGILLTMDPTLHFKMTTSRRRADDEPVTELQFRSRQLSTLVVNVKTHVQSSVKPLTGG